jgi:hypothetical protein
MKAQPYNSFIKHSQSRSCDHEGCQEEGNFRAPRNRNQLHLYHWFCLNHIRAYNANWNYYAGMNETEMELHRRADITWERPTWPIKHPRFRTKDFVNNRIFEDPLQLFASKPTPQPVLDPAARVFHSQSKEHEALIVLCLQGPLTFNHVKCAYRTLVKKHHPDAHQGCKIAEEHIKRINNAYGILQKAFKG